MTQITWLGHSAFELRFPSGEVLVMDPWIEGNPKYPTGYKLKRVDAIALSHAHFDHSNDVIPLAKEFSPKLIPLPIFWMIWVRPVFTSNFWRCVLLLLCL